MCLGCYCVFRPWRDCLFVVLVFDVTPPCRTNLPKEVMMFPDFPFDPELPSFLPHQEVLRYLERYSQNYGITPHIRVLSLRQQPLHLGSVTTVSPPTSGYCHYSNNPDIRVLSLRQHPPHPGTVTTATPLTSKYCYYGNTPHVQVPLP